MQAVPIRVLTVPMRNGNKILITRMKTSKQSVLTVPMRNGNILNTITKIFALGEFLPYLWGMETPHSHGSLATTIKVLTVPMRNGNTSGGLFGILWEVLVLTVPMRNGNNFRNIKRILLLTCSYRTYEEWKPTRDAVDTASTSSFLPYLWGMETFLNLEPISLVNSSYRTYEEWKPATRNPDFAGSEVLTVPMRNGNCVTEKELGKLLFPFLPYLWGMETFYCALDLLLRIRVLTVPMRNGND